MKRYNEGFRPTSTPLLCFGGHGRGLSSALDATNLVMPWDPTYLQ